VGHDEAVEGGNARPSDEVIHSGLAFLNISRSVDMHPDWEGEPAGFPGAEPSRKGNAGGPRC